MTKSLRPGLRFACAVLLMLLSGLLQPDAVAQRSDATLFATITIDQRAVRFEMMLPDAAPLSSAERGLQVISNGKPCPLAKDSKPADPVVSTGMRLDLNFACTEAPGILGIRYGLFDLLGKDHRTLALILWPGGSQQFTFEPGMPELRLDVGSGVFRNATGTSFGLGLQHLLLGWGYLVFLGCLLMPVRDRRQLLWTALAFAAASGLVIALCGALPFRLPGRLLEAAIALSVIFVGAWNLFRDGHMSPSRWGIGLLLGGIHGLALAQPLIEATLLRDLWAGGLPGYLLGVQVGMAGFIVVATPVMLWIRRNPWGPRAESAISSVAVVLGAAVLWMTLGR